MTSPRTSLAGAVIVVTGGGSGIGEATSRLCAARGARVAVADLHEDQADRVSAAIRSAGGTSVGIEVDVAREDGIDAMIERTERELGPLTGIVNNAGMILTRTIAETSLADWEATMAVNATGAFLGTRALVRRLVAARRSGSIVNIGSISATVGLAGQAAYCASKGAVLQLSRQVAVDYASQGIRCNVVSPGSVMTPVLDDYLDGQPNPDAARREISRAHPVGRLAEPWEIAEVVAFLLSPAAQFVTGANYCADGGYTAV